MLAKCEISYTRTVLFQYLFNLFLLYRTEEAGLNMKYSDSLRIDSGFYSIYSGIFCDGIVSVYPNRFLPHP